MLLMTLVAPVLEEFVMRAGLHDAMLRRDRAVRAAYSAATAPVQMSGTTWRLIALSSAFGLLHLPRGIGLAIAVVPAAMVIGWVYERTRSWTSCALLHATMNWAWLGLGTAGVALPSL
jgi:uncharacterized protein